MAGRDDRVELGLVLGIRVRVRGSVLGWVRVSVEVVVVTLTILSPEPRP